MALGPTHRSWCSLCMVLLGTVEHSVRRARASDLEAGARVLAAAFASYPWTRWVLPSDGYADRLEEVQRLYLAHALEHGIVMVDDGVRAIAALLPPDPPAPPARTQHRVVELHGSRYSALAGLVLPRPPAGAWTLETVGVHPAHQGTGLGTALVTSALGAGPPSTGLVALETSDERNVRLYERLGFASLATTEICDGPVVHSMVRVPRQT